MTDEFAPPDFRKYRYHLLRWWWLPVALGLLFASLVAGSGFGGSSARSTAVLVPFNPSQVTVFDPMYEPLAGLKASVEAVESEAIDREVAAELGFDPSVQVRMDPLAGTVTLTSTDQTLDRASAARDAFVGRLLEARRTSISGAIDSAITSLTDREAAFVETIATLDEAIAASDPTTAAALGASVDRATTVAELGRVRADHAALTALDPEERVDVRLEATSERASVAAPLSGPIGVLGAFIAGAFIGLLVVIGRAYFDTRIRTRSDLAQVGVQAVGSFDASQRLADASALALAVAIRGARGDVSKPRRTALLAFDGVDGDAVAQQVTQAAEALEIDLGPMEVASTAEERIRAADASSSVVVLIAPGRIRSADLEAELSGLQRTGTAVVGAALVARNLAAVPVDRVDAPDAGLRRPAVATMVTSLAIAGIGFVTVTLIGRKLGPEGRGSIALFQLIPSIGALVFAVGLPHACTYFVALDVRHAARIVRRHASLAIPFGFGGALVTAIVAGAYLAGDHEDDLVRATIIFAIGVLVIPTLATFVHPCRSVGRYRRWNVLRFFAESSMLGIAVYVLILGGTSYTWMAAVQVAWLILLLFVASLFWTSRTGAATAEPNRRAILRFGLPTMLATLPAFLNFRVDQLLLQSLRGTRELGLYATAVTWSAASLPIVNTMANLALPYLARLEGGRPTATGRLMRVTFVLAGSGALLFSATAPLAIRLTSGPEFNSSIAYAMVLCWGTAALGVITTAEEALRAHGDVGFPARAQIIGLVVNVAALFVLIPPFGAWGAVLASIGCYGAIGVVTVRRVSRVAVVPMAELVPRRDDVRTLFGALRADAVTGVGR